jgi:hypothetical protein
MFWQFPPVVGVYEWRTVVERGQAGFLLPLASFKTDQATVFFLFHLIPCSYYKLTTNGWPPPSGILN